MNPSAVSARSPSLSDLGALVTVQYPDRPDLALIAALHLLSAVGGSTGITVAYAQGALLTRRARTSLRAARLPANVNEARHLSDVTNGGVLLIGNPEPTVVIMGPGTLLDITTTYRLEDLELPARLLHGVSSPSPSSRAHTLVEYPYGLTGVYSLKRLASPLSVASRLMCQLGPLTRRRVENDIRQLEPSWRQLRDCA